MLERQFDPVKTAEFKRSNQARSESLSLPSAEQKPVLKPLVKEELTFISPFDTAAFNQINLEQAYFFWQKVEAQLKQQLVNGDNFLPQTNSVSQTVLTRIIN